MKKFLMVLALALLFTLQGLHATGFSSYLPGGKNYIDENNFEHTGNSIDSIDSIRVKPNTTYTLSFPGDALLRDTEIELISSSIIYITGQVNGYPGCIIDQEFAECVFTTDSNDEYIDISIYDVQMTEYLNYNGFTRFQLEEGSSRTLYEEYIIPLTDVNSPEFSGAGAFIMAYYESFTIEEIIGNHIMVVDDIDGDLSSDIQIISDDYTANINTVGEYLVVLKATDTSGNSSTFNLTVIIKDEVGPEIVGPDAINVLFDDQLSVEEIISTNYSASDGHDGNLLITIDSDSYTINKNYLGSYSVTISAVDGSMNSTIKDVIINIIDTTAPVIDAGNVINTYLSDPKTINHVLAMISVTDNYDDRGNLLFGLNIDGFSDNEEIVGTYEIEVVIMDTSSNTITETLYVNVIDDVYPVISGPNDYSYSYTNSHSLEDILNLISVNDNYDTLLSDNIVITSNTFSTRTTEIGDFIITLEIGDESGNITQHTINITIFDDVAPIIYVDNYLVTLSGNVSFDSQDALQMLINNYELPNGNYQITTLSNEYKGNEDIPGTYQYSLQFTGENGDSYQKDFIIKVPEPDAKVFNQALILRNAITYSSIIGISIFVFIRKKK